MACSLLNAAATMTWPGAIAIVGCAFAVAFALVGFFKNAP